MRVALLFIDGVGVGRADPGVNPLARERYLLSQFTDAPGTPLPPGGSYHPVDATFGVAGRPQSASNQTALLTARDAPALVGRHVLGFPDRALRELLAAHSLVRQLTLHGRTASFANAYPAAYLDALGIARRPADAPHLDLDARMRRRLKASASTLAFHAAAVPLRTFTDAQRGLGLTHDITGQRARERGADVPLRTETEAAALFWRLSAEADFLFFEHYLADEAGHAQDFEAAREALGSFDRFLRVLVDTRPPDVVLLVCSDHGNVEDLTTRGHTLHAVPVLAFASGHALPMFSTVADVGRAVLHLLGVS